MNAVELQDALFRTLNMYGHSPTLVGEWWAKLIKEFEDSIRKDEQNKADALRKNAELGKVWPQRYDVHGKNT